MTRLLLLLALFAPLAPEAAAQPSASHEAAVRELLDVTNAAESHANLTSLMMDAMASNNPQFAEYRGILEDFYALYYRWEDIATAQVEVYTEFYTEAEIRELIAWYGTPLGQKSLRQMPDLQRRLAAAGQAILQPHLPELEAMLVEAMSPPPEPERDLKKRL